MKSVFHLVALFLCTACAAHVADESKVMPKVTALPMALSDDFEFRKVKLFSSGKTTSDATKSANRRLSGRSGNRVTAAVAEASIISNHAPAFRRGDSTR